MGRVAITGMGVISPIGIGKEALLESLKSNRIGIDRISLFDCPEDFPVKIGGEVKDFNPTEYMDRKVARRYDRVLQFAVAAAKMAYEDSGLDIDDSLAQRTAVLVTSGIGGFRTLWGEMKRYQKFGPNKVSPFLIPMMIVDMISGVVAIHLGLKGPNFSPVSACASSSHSIALGTMFVEHGIADVAFVGGAEAVIDELPIAAFASMKALSTRNEEPRKASRPFDKNRDGFVMSEGAAVLVLEREELAKARGARIYGYIKGYGMTGDAYHLSAPDPEGRGAEVAMRIAIEKAQLKPEDIQYVNAHATGTPVGDSAELKAIKKVMGKHSNDVVVNSTKGLAGHLLGAAGAFEMICALLMMKEGFVHGHPNLEEPDDECEGLKVPKNEILNMEITNFISNSFGFGGHNVSLVVGRG